jgi:hypothetical protein
MLAPVIFFTGVFLTGMFLTGTFFTGTVFSGIDSCPSSKTSVAAKSKTHRASVSGGAGFGSLQDFALLAHWFPPHRRECNNSYPQDYDTNSVPIEGIHTYTAKRLIVYS